MTPPFSRAFRIAAAVLGQIEACKTLLDTKPNPQVVGRLNEAFLRLDRLVGELGAALAPIQGELTSAHRQVHPHAVRLCGVQGVNWHDAIRELGHRQRVRVLAATSNRTVSLQDLERIRAGFARISIKELEQAGWEARQEADMAAGRAPPPPRFELPPTRAGRVALIESNTEPRRPPLCPEIELRLFRRDAPLWRDWGPELFCSGPRPYWAFCWAGGQALARYVLDRPELVRGRRVVDFGAGSGVAAIAAALSGASDATAVECDPLAVLAVEMNAALNHVCVRAQLVDPERRELGEWDVLLAADVCYDGNADWLFGLAGQRGLALIADPGRVEFPLEQFTPLRQYDARDVPETGHFDNLVTVYRRTQCS